jgi:hypothetical protein
VIPKSGRRFSEKITRNCLKPFTGVIHRSACNFQPNSGHFPQYRRAASRFRRYVI